MATAVRENYLDEREENQGRQLANGLAWFSLGLGLTELLAPKTLARLIGVRESNAGLIRAFGAREIASGLAIWSQGERPVEAVWSRVAGDALDLTALGKSMASSDTNKGKVAFATLNVLAVTGLDVLCARKLGGNDGHSSRRIVKGMIIDRSREELYKMWRNFDNLPKFMKHLEYVRATDHTFSHWAAKGPAGKIVEWDAEITQDIPNELISWRSLDGASIDHSGTVRFIKTPGSRGTLVQVEMQYAPPGGVVGTAIAGLMGKNPGQLTEESLRDFKQYIETGEIIVSDGTLWDNGLLTQRPAQPSEE